MKIMSLISAVVIMSFFCNSNNLYNEYVLGNKDHELSCNQLPSEAIVEQIIQKHKDIVTQIEQINHGFVFVDIDNSNCPGRADIVINFASYKDRVEIEKIINGDTFFGVPYRLRNR